MLVVVILAILAAITIPRLTNASDSAREKADIATAREVKAALDRFQLETGSYPTMNDLRDINGEISGSPFIPDYIRRLDSTVTQQNAPEGKKGFGISRLPEGSSYPSPEYLIMIYLTTDGTAAEVRVYDKNLSKVIWSSI